MESGNGYVIQLKGNRQWLLRSVRRQIEEGAFLSEYQTRDLKNGRKDNRDYTVYKVNQSKIPKGYESIHSVIKVHRHGFRNRKAYSSTAYYISDQTFNATQFAKGIRGHWSIENLLHRTKDVVQFEDKNMIKNKTLAANVSILQTLTINILRIAGYKSIKKGNELFANRISKSSRLIINV